MKIIEDYEFKYAQGGVIQRPSIGLFHFAGSGQLNKRGILTFEYFKYIANVKSSNKPIRYYKPYNTLIIDSIGLYDFMTNVTRYIKGDYKMPDNLLDKESFEPVEYKIKFVNKKGK
ncbi:MAG: hypothetical protein K8R35_01515 [Bacteroidales bacterium]|nr:hypothetical protein [Bacteroidales bacterium]